MRKFLVAVFLAFVALLLTACGGGGSSDKSLSITSGSGSGSGGSSGQPSSLPVTVGPTTTLSGTNVLPISVESGPVGVNVADVIYATVTICVHGTNTCQTIDHVQVDTQSTGLRILASALPNNFWQQLAPVTNGSNPYAECTLFGDGFSWGPMMYADAQLGGESASNLPIQIIGDSSVSSALPSIPSACVNSSTGGSEDTPANFGANGIIGIASPQQDCGADCALNLNNSSYFTCTNTTSSGTCVRSTIPVASQTQNPVVKFASNDTNGTMITLPAIPATGATQAQGYLVFGIGTSSNNVMGSGLNVLATTTQANTGDNYVTTTFDGVQYQNSLVDSGTSVLEVPNTNAQIPVCADGLYLCPPSTETFSATMTGQNGVAVPLQFSIANADALYASGYFAFDNLGAPSGSALFIWGSPFFFGRQVFTAIEGKTVTGTSVIPPFVAF